MNKMIKKCLPLLLAILLLISVAPIKAYADEELSEQQEETSEIVVEKIDNSYKLEDKNDDWDFL